MSWVLTRGLATVRAEFNTVFPGRDKSSDGSVGNLAHQGSVSGHNPDRTGNAEYRDGDSLDEVRSIDVDRDLVPGSSTQWMELVVQYLVKKARAGGYIPFHYIIYKSRIWSRTDGWRTRSYDGANSHDHHAHFSGGYTQTADNWTGSLGLGSLIGEDDMELGDSLEPWGQNTTVGAALAVLLTRTNYLGNTLSLASRLDSLKERLEVAIREAADDPQIPSVPSLSEEQVAGIAAQIATKLPTLGQYADAVVDKTAARLSS